LTSWSNSKDQAKAEGRLTEFRRGIQTIHNQLTDHAREFGELLYHHRHAMLAVRLAVIRPVVVYWGVHHFQEIVFVKDLYLLEKH
jgi:hypothetical protein